MIRYYKLWDVLKRRNMTMTQLAEMSGLARITLTNMNKGIEVRTGTIAKICKCLKIQPADMMEYIEEE